MRLVLLHEAVTVKLQRRIVLRAISMFYIRISPILFS